MSLMQLISLCLCVCDVALTDVIDAVDLIDVPGVEQEALVK